jgi:hypothetical protein
MSDLIGITVVEHSYRIRQQVAWVGENRKKKEFHYPNVPSNVLSWNFEPDGKEYTHKLLIADNLLGQLIHDLAWERPQWTFLVVTQVGNVDTGREAVLRPEKLLILDKLEPIGIVKWTRSYRGEVTLSITNNRISQDLVNKNSRSTSKLKRAKQIINKDVFGLSVREVLRGASNNLINNMRQAVDTVNRKANERYVPVTDWVRAQLVGHSPELVAFIEKMGQAEIVQTFMDAADDSTLAKSVKNDIDVGAGKMVVLVGNDYHIARMGGASPTGTTLAQRYTKYTRDGLDPGIHTALALLKLTEPNTFVSGAGFKASDTEYFIVEEITIGQD